MRIPRLRNWCAAVFAGVWLAHSALALDPTRAFSQYVHDYWDSDNGFPGGAVYAICQTQDGYLWIGTERGLVRFDGFQFKLIQIPIPNAPLLGQSVASFRMLKVTSGFESTVRGCSFTGTAGLKTHTLATD